MKKINSDMCWYNNLIVKMPADLRRKKIRTDIYICNEHGRKLKKM